MQEVPIILQIKNVPDDFSACDDRERLAVPDLGAIAKEQIISKYEPAFDCRLLNNLTLSYCRSIGERMCMILFSKSNCALLRLHATLFS